MGNASRMLGAVLLVLGALALVYGGFSYTRESTALKLGPVQVDVKERERVNIPLWGGVAAVVAGGLLLVAGGTSRR
jgi:uncharacterized membrane protein YidH (DUF202 family)